MYMVSEFSLAGFAKLAPFPWVFSASLWPLMHATNSSHFVISRADQRARQTLDNDNYNHFLLPISRREHLVQILSVRKVWDNKKDVF